MLKRLVFCVLLLPTAACALQPELPSEPPQELEIAWFLDDCAPWDGLATSLYLGREIPADKFNPGFPNLHVAIYSSLLQRRSGELLRFDVPSHDGHARYCANSENCVNATAVTIEFSKVERSLLEGRLEVVFKEREPIRGSFRATKMAGRTPCG
jgi:hypothetical protein